MSKFTELKKAINTLRKAGCTSITVDRKKFRRVLIDDDHIDWPFKRDEEKDEWWINEATDKIRVYGINIDEITVTEY